MQYILLSQDFFNDYPQSKYLEIEQKANRVYISIIIKISSYQFAIPLRTNINHKWKMPLKSKPSGGLDFTKTILLDNANYISSSPAHLPQTDFNYLKGKDNLIEKKFMEYIKEYVEAVKTSDPNKQGASKYSTLSYFSDKINYEDLIDKYFNKTTV